MELEVLENFKDLSELLSFTAAAKKGHISQSALSKRIAGLERDLNAKLIARDSRGIYITPEGQLVLNGALKVIDTWNKTLAHLETMREGHTSVLRVGYLEGAFLPFLPALLHAFSECEPHIELELYSLEHNELHDRLENNKIDIALTELYKNNLPAGCESYDIFEDYCCVVVARESALASKPVLTLADLEGKTVLTGSDSQSKYADIYMRAFKEAGITVTLKRLFNSFDEISARLSDKQSMTIIPSHLMAAGLAKQLVFIPLDCEQLIHTASAVWKKSHEQPVFTSFLNAIQRVIPFRRYISCSWLRLCQSEH